MKIEINKQTLYYDIRNMQGGRDCRIYRPVSKKVIFDIYNSGDYNQTELASLLKISVSTVMQTCQRVKKGMYDGITTKNVYSVTNKKAHETTLQDLLDKAKGNLVVAEKAVLEIEVAMKVMAKHGLKVS